MVYDGNSYHPIQKTSVLLQGAQEATAIICGATAGLLEPLKAALVSKEDTSAAGHVNTHTHIYMYIYIYIYICVYELGFLRTPAAPQGISHGSPPPLWMGNPVDRARGTRVRLRVVENDAGALHIETHRCV